METATARRIFPAAILGGSAAGALAAFFLVRRELGRLQRRAERPSRNSEAVPAATSSEPSDAALVADAALPAEAEVEEVSPEALSVISAVVAAFFGKSARVSAVRPVRAAPSPWAQEGRVSVQGSHQLARQ